MKINDAHDTLASAAEGETETAPVAIDRRTLPTAVAERLRDMIIEGELAAGTRLNERALCERLQVSRTPLREAFRLLCADGLVRMQPNRGAQVIALSEDDIRQSFEVMGALEALSGELACLHISDREIIEIRALTFEMQACHARGDLSSYYHVNREIHDRINAASHNPLLSEVYRSINLRLQNLRFRSNLNHDKWDRAMREHLDMVDALEARDGARLSGIMREHMKRKGEAVLEGLRQETRPPNPAG
ncbi:GntR family transcriptional regulator [Allopusillimonas soli]|uniref:GntR family transcriptional regulator n=1 Tax=Allopusillimonas soli TaxID=659016 RepID=A0A853F912_9BURK|nr:GntR family transcriptional regulator [Allopusillimonas soli]NYT37155.1 GntR family transcriptional regulator [Allopusillimonas soli]TEA75579.1 GntR family transcriptional regulator [Allopusillimonas soli]